MGYIFALIAPFLDNIVVYIDKFLLSKHSINSTALTIYSGFFAGITGAIVFLFTGLYITDLLSTIIITASGFFGVYYLLAYFKALSLDEASRVGSLFQIVPVFVLILSFIFLGEKFLFKQYIGCFFIIVSGFLFSIQKIDRGFLKLNKAFWYMMLACFFSACIYVSFKIGVKDIGFWNAIPYEALGNTLAALTILVYKNNYKMVKKEVKNMSKKVFIYLLVSEFIYRMSRFSFYMALLLIPAGIVSVLMGFQPFFLLIMGIILSVWFPHIIQEVVNKKTVTVKLIAVVGIFIGLSFIFL